MPALFRMRRAFDGLWREENKLLEVRVSSAVDLDESTIKSIGSRIEEQTGQKIDLDANVDPDLIGGLSLRVGNMLLDATVRGRLERLRKELARAA